VEAIDAQMVDQIEKAHDVVDDEVTWQSMVNGVELANDQEVVLYEFEEHYHMHRYE
jgi:hypothetical protein